jgi:hypothetical protein
MNCACEVSRLFERVLPVHGDHYVVAVLLQHGENEASNRLLVLGQQNRFAVSGWSIALDSVGGKDSSPVARAGPNQRLSCG